jgi:nuclear pore complex protein Nup205
MLLLLIWRHTQYYSEPQNALPPARGASMTNAMRLLATTDPRVFRSEVVGRLQPVLHKLDSIELVSVL